MNKKSKKYLTALLLSVLMCSVGCSIMLQSTAAEELTPAQKGLNMLRDVLCLDLGKYTITTSTETMTIPLTVPANAWTSDTVTYSLTSAETQLKIQCFFGNGYFISLEVLENQGASELKLIDNDTANIQLLLEAYQKYFVATYKYQARPILGELSPCLDGIDITNDYTKTVGNRQFDVLVYDNNRTEFRWSYTVNPFLGDPQFSDPAYERESFVVLKFTDGFLTEFRDIYPIPGPVPSPSPSPPPSPSPTSSISETDVKSNMTQPQPSTISSADVDSPGADSPFSIDIGASLEVVVLAVLITAVILVGVSFFILKRNKVPIKEP
ncbi:hypothetical protein [Candidatus Bathycorpusculum sp.]|uniref:hypothetical protein n=1 Tax=Candidatus Bathycorpusculum sp. TaxID=2994959 RepID=UPI00282FE4C4|nr:hypothetical protein [Candidatus Termitimicrobium sp.]